MVGDPPFVRDEAEALMVSEQMFDFQEQLYKFPPQIRNPQFGDFTYSFERSGRMEGWKIGWARAWVRGCLGAGESGGEELSQGVGTIFPKSCDTCLVIFG